MGAAVDGPVPDAWLPERRRPGLDNRFHAMTSTRLRRGSDVPSDGPNRTLEGRPPLSNVTRRTMPRTTYVDAGSDRHRAPALGRSASPCVVPKGRRPRAGR